MRRLLGFILVFIFITIVSVNVGEAKNFSDLRQNHWAYGQVKKLVEAGVISGYEDGTFRPNGMVTRAEFAKILVNALKLKIQQTSNSDFLDIPRDHWAKQYVEAAKYYLTGFKTSKGDYFKPDLPSVREDMAVAIVKAKGLEDEKYNKSTLDKFNDKNLISKNLQGYVAIAVEKGIMVGSEGSDRKMYFRPQDNITRAETAVLLDRVSNISGDKVTYDEEDKVDYDNNINLAKTPKLEYSVENGRIALNWTEVDNDDFRYYKVVLSKSDRTPEYPDNGYIAHISDVNRNYLYITEGMSYEDGDFGRNTVSGDSYYVSITTVYNDVKYTSNTIRVTLP
ncbi:MAG TPA: hypothetical protein DEP72_03425 [Clostridiales bacterium]|nr:MAG: hypothetical protein A2Y18_03160 [Clostridiales bacterium GWD2_32_19]HCC07204.1 hypothetical protein [Clostridiales bacterium]